MFWAIASSIFIIYLYRKLNAERIPATENVSADNLQATLSTIDARIAVLESKIGVDKTSDVKP